MTLAGVVTKVAATLSPISPNEGGAGGLSPEAMAMGIKRLHGKGIHVPSAAAPCGHNTTKGNTGTSTGTSQCSSSKSHAARVSLGAPHSAPGGAQRGEHVSAFAPSPQRRRTRRAGPPTTLSREHACHQLDAVVQRVRMRTALTRLAHWAQAYNAAAATVQRRYRAHFAVRTQAAATLQRGYRRLKLLHLLRLKRRCGATVASACTIGVVAHPAPQPARAQTAPVAAPLPAPAPAPAPAPVAAMQPPPRQGRVRFKARRRRKRPTGQQSAACPPVPPLCPTAGPPRAKEVVQAPPPAVNPSPKPCAPPLPPPLPEAPAQARAVHKRRRGPEARADLGQEREQRGVGHTSCDAKPLNPLECEETKQDRALVSQAGSRVVRFGRRVLPGMVGMHATLSDDDIDCKVSEDEPQAHSAAAAVAPYMVSTKQQGKEKTTKKKRGGIRRLFRWRRRKGAKAQAGAQAPCPPVGAVPATPIKAAPIAEQNVELGLDCLAALQGHGVSPNTACRVTEVFFTTESVQLEVKLRPGMTKKQLFASLERATMLASGEQ